MVSVHCEVGIGVAETTLINVSTSFCVTSPSRLSITNWAWLVKVAKQQQRAVSHGVVFGSCGCTLDVPPPRVYPSAAIKLSPSMRVLISVTVIGRTRYL